MSLIAAVYAASRALIAAVYASAASRIPCVKTIFTGIDARFTWQIRINAWYTVFMHKSRRGSERFTCALRMIHYLRTIYTVVPHDLRWMVAQKF